MCRPLPAARGAVDATPRAEAAAVRPSLQILFIYNLYRESLVCICLEARESGVRRAAVYHGGTPGVAHGLVRREVESEHAFGLFVAV